MISRERLDEFKDKLKLITDSTLYYLEMSDKIIQEYENCDKTDIEKLEEYDRKLADVQGKILSEQRTQRLFEEEYSDVVEYLRSSE